MSHRGRVASSLACFFVLILTMLLVVCPPSLLAIPVPALDLDSLVADSSVIATGEVVSLNAGVPGQFSVGGKQVRGRRVVGVIRVEQVLKGPGLREIPFAYVLPETFLGWRSVELHQVAIFFLTSSAEGRYQFTSPYYPFVPASRGTSGSGSEAIERVASVLGATALANGISDGERLSAIRTLSYSRSSAAMEQLQRLLNSESLTVQVEVGAELLRRNDLSGLDVVVRALLTSPSGVPVSVDQDALAAISWGLANRNAIPQLKELLASNDPDIRRAATASLMRTNSPAAVGPLLSALTDSDFQTRYFAVVGLADMTGQPAWRPSMDQFRSDENKYLQHWKEWSASQKQR